MKRCLFFLGLIFLTISSAARAQTEVNTIDTLAVDLWPDFDRTAVLVLLTGTLPADTRLPAQVTIPLPAGAELNAVARITDDNVMTDDIEYTAGADAVTLTTPDARFRVEYYLPYTTNGTERTFTFTWQANTAVNTIEVAVQQPGAAANLHTQPIAASIGRDEMDGFTYHVLPAQPVPAGETYSVNVSYMMDEPALSINQPPPDLAPVAAPATAGLNWPLFLAAVGGALIVAAVAWQVMANWQRPTQPRKTAAPAKHKPARFCHECGTPLQAGDKFCRACGTAVKQPHA